MDKLLKICGMRDAAQIGRVVEEFHPDFMGFIFYKPSKRYVGEGFSLPEMDWGSTRKVGVFVNEPIEDLKKIVRKTGLDAVQLHGDESEEYIKIVQEEPVFIIKAFRVDESFDFEDAARFEGLAHMFLFDAKTEGYGGGGKAFDWQLLNRYQGNTPFLVGGGVGVENVEELLRLSHPMFKGIDVNSRVEISPGLKNENTLKELAKIAR